MPLIKLGIRHFRNLERVDLSLSPSLNFFYGANASGKTSLLEAIFFLGRMNSFRTHRFERLLQHEKDQLSVLGTLLDKNGQKNAFGVEKGQKSAQIRINGQKISKVADLVTLFPIQVIHPNSHQLLEEGPKNRRKFLDWGVFHVEQSFYPAWQRYQRALKQRNSALRQQNTAAGIGAWDPELVETSRVIHEQRHVYLDEFKPIALKTVHRILGPLDLELDYYPGWDEKLGLGEVLRQSLGRDRDSGYTHHGPHRADMRILVDGIPAHEKVSRGQQKILVFSLLLAQADLYREKTGRICSVLLDDVAAELDPNHRQRLLQVLQGLQAQYFITAIERDSLEFALTGFPERKMFHVEHGQVQEVV